MGTVTTRIALLRAVNLGGHNRLPMAELRDLLDGLGYGNPRTYIQSGNALFRTDEPEAVCAERIAGAILDRLGLTIDVMVRTDEQLHAALAANPFPGEDGARVLVVFCSTEPDPAAVRALDRRRFFPDVFEVRGREVFCHFPNGMGRSKLPSLKLVASGTGRNVNTVRKLVELAEAQP